jgi:hypothetical protein
MVRGFYHAKSGTMFAACYPMYRMNLRYKKPQVWRVDLVDMNPRKHKPTNGTVYEFPMLQEEPEVTIMTLYNYKSGTMYAYPIWIDAKWRFNGRNLIPWTGKSLSFQPAKSSSVSLTKVRHVNHLEI